MRTLTRLAVSHRQKASDEHGTGTAKWFACGGAAAVLSRDSAGYGPVAGGRAEKRRFSERADRPSGHPCQPGEFLLLCLPTDFDVMP